MNPYERVDADATQEQKAKEERANKIQPVSVLRSTMLRRYAPSQKEKETNNTSNQNYIQKNSRTENTSRRRRDPER